MKWPNVQRCFKATQIQERYVWMIKARWQNKTEVQVTWNLNPPLFFFFALCLSLLCLVLSLLPRHSPNLKVFSIQDRNHTRFVFSSHLFFSSHRFDFQIVPKHAFERKTISIDIIARKKHSCNTETQTNHELYSVVVWCGVLCCAPRGLGVSLSWCFDSLLRSRLESVRAPSDINHQKLRVSAGEPWQICTLDSHQLAQLS